MENDRQKTILVTIDHYLKEITAGYIANRRRDVEILRASLKTADFETLRALGHTMKGSGGGYGFDRITELGHALEQAAKGRDPAALASISESLADYLERIIIVYS